MKYIHYLLILFSLIAIGGCKEKVVNPTVSTTLETNSVSTLNINDFNVELSQRGIISRGFWGNVGVIYMAGLWIGMDNSSQPRGDIVITKGLPNSNFTSQWGDKQLGVFTLYSNINYLPENWPINYGAPTNESGLPKIYGDEMCWTALQSDTTMKDQLYYASPINGLQVTEAVYGYKKDYLRSTIFIKYSITNLSTEIWNNIYVGFFSDTDLFNYSINRTGYDSVRSMSYTYDTTNNYVTGFSFMETPKNVGVGSHRIMRRNDYIDPDFGEYSFILPEQIILALKGLSNSGQPMINPVTGLVTKFAFTGDPVTHTGWLDTPVDVRSLLSTESFSLSPGETTWITITWVVTHDTVSLSNALSELKTIMDLIKADVSLWQFN